MRKPKICGIYRIYNIDTGYSYIGSSINISRRWLTHLNELKNNNHINTNLQNDFNLFGKDKFILEILELVINCTILTERENYWINSIENLYNANYINSDMKFTNLDISRFWSWVQLGEVKECWDWKGAKGKNGYGKFYAKNNGKNRQYIASRVAFFISCPDKWNKFLMICHKCDNPSCCNPSHLFIGTASENQKDRASKGKGYKINKETVDKIRNSYKQSNILPIDLWKEYEDLGLKYRAFKEILQNHTFYDNNWVYEERRKDFKRDFQTINKIRETYLKYGYSYAALARQFNMSDSNITRVVCNEIHKSEEYAQKLKDRQNV